MDRGTPARVAGAGWPSWRCLRDRARRSGSRDTERRARASRTDIVYLEPAASQGTSVGSPDRLPDERARASAGSRISSPRNCPWTLWNGVREVADGCPGGTRAVSRILADVGLCLLGRDGRKAFSAGVGRNAAQVRNREATYL